VAQLNDSLQRDQERVQREFTAHKERLEKELDLTRRRQDQAYIDKLDGKIAEEFWNRQMSELARNEQRIARQLAALTEPPTEKLLTVARTLELAQKAHSIYLAQDPAEQPKLLSLVLSNCEVDEVSVCPQYNIPLDLMLKEQKLKIGWGGWTRTNTILINSEVSYRLDHAPTRCA
jgi:hypothetical protein